MTPPKTPRPVSPFSYSSLLLFSSLIKLPGLPIVLLFQRPFRCVTLVLELCGNPKLDHHLNGIRPYLQISFLSLPYLFWLFTWAPLSLLFPPFFGVSNLYLPFPFLDGNCILFPILEPPWLKAPKVSPFRLSPVGFLSSLSWPVIHLVTTPLFLFLCWSPVLSQLDGPPIIDSLPFFNFPPFSNEHTCLASLVVTCPDSPVTRWVLYMLTGPGEAFFASQPQPLHLTPPFFFSPPPAVTYLHSGVLCLKHPLFFPYLPRRPIPKVHLPFKVVGPFCAKRFFLPVNIHLFS